MANMNIEQARHLMIEQQIRPWDVLDQRILDTILRTPREDFVPPAHRKLAFTDMMIPIGHDEVMMEPKLEARMLQALNIKPTDKVLEIGTGSGYVTALLASLAKQVYSVDIHEDFCNSAREKLEAHGFTNVTIEQGDAVKGWSAHASYNVIAVTGSLPMLTADIQKNLEVGGRMFVVAGEAPIMEAMLITRTNANEFHVESLFETVVPALANAPHHHSFAL